MKPLKLKVKSELNRDISWQTFSLVEENLYIKVNTKLILNNDLFVLIFFDVDDRNNETNKNPSN